MSASEKIEAALVSAGVVTAEQIQIGHDARAVDLARDGYAPTLLAYLVTTGQIEDNALLDWLANYYQVQKADLSRFAPDERTADWLRGRVPPETAFRCRVVPIKREGQKVVVGMVDPRDQAAMEEIAFLGRFAVVPAVVSDAALSEALLRLYEQNPLLPHATPASDVEVSVEVEKEQFSPREVDVSAFLVGYSDIELLDEEPEPESSLAGQARPDEAPVIRIVNGILSNAVTRGASDIHIEQGERDFRVRFRIDGELTVVEKLPFTLRGAIISRVKIMANLKIDERRQPQDGRMKLRVARNRVVDFRVSTLPGQWGEKVVLRLLDRASLKLDIERFGLSRSAEAALLHAIKQPHGMVFVTGPTGSGKTTTLYAALSRLNDTVRNIVTVEDPVEYNLAGITQVHVRPEVGLTFASALRSILRQDPDVIMVGEVRDTETAEVAVQAAQTGHLVLSTLHTNSAPDTITRLLDMGVPAYAVAAGLRLVVAQRLVRCICPACKVEAEMDEASANALNLSSEERTHTYYRGSGKSPLGGRCSTCHGSGYSGRTGIYEVLPVTPAVRQMILRADVDTDALRALALSEGMTTLRMDGIRKAREGTTTLEQVVRVTTGDDILD